MIELTNEQIDALGLLNGGVQEVVNPRTKEVFVLVPLEEYKRTESDDEVDFSPWTREEMLLMADRVADEVGWIEWPEETGDEKKT